MNEQFNINSLMNTCRKTGSKVVHKSVAEQIYELAQTRFRNTGLSNEQISKRSEQVAKVVVQLYKIMRLDLRENIEQSLIRNIDIQINICNERHLWLDS